jgi:ABC-type branched-subunit amino acid transport system substrate-binding protein
MPARALIAGALVLALADIARAHAQAAPSQAPPSEPIVPFAKARDRAVGYEGPGREEAPPADLTEIRLGWFGPGEATHAQGGDFWRGATLALGESNAQGGWQGLPFRLVVGWSDNPWTGGAAQVARLVFQERVWAIAGSIDGAATHVAEQLAVKVGLIVLSPGSTDKTANMANVPWMLSLLPSDAAQARPLVGALAATAGVGPFAVVSSTDHDARAAWAEFGAELSRRRLSPATHVEVQPEEERLDEVVARALAGRPGAVLVVAGARPAGRLVHTLRVRGYAGPVFGGATLGRSAFREEAGGAAEGAVFPLLAEPSPAWDAFAARFRSRYDREADYAAGSSYDAVRLLVEAVRKAGPNRPRILDALRALSPWAGVTGTISFDPLGQNERTVGLGTIRRGHIEPLPVRR